MPTKTEAMHAVFGEADINLSPLNEKKERKSGGHGMMLWN
jgi:hypothetical protein